ncbi:anoctamin-7 isoform X7 [Macaca nemestrina]|uniref:anoctamin-7 isoform X7 n=1 Tax=Macaca nemestrina TaxID=9545 RepID=UPI0039B8C8F0
MRVAATAWAGLQGLPLPTLCPVVVPGLYCQDQAHVERWAMTSEASSGSHCARSRMLRRRAQEEDNTVLINVSPPEAENRGPYGSTAHTSEPGGQQAAACRAGAGSPAKPRIADFVLVWEEDLKLDWQQNSASRDRTDTHRTWRETFLDNLRAAGLHVDRHDVQDGNTTVHYTLLSASWAVLCYYAEDLRLKLPLQELPNQASNWSAELLAWLGIPNVLLEVVPDVPPEYYSCQFRVNKLPRFLGSDNQDTFFTSTKRHQILFEILAKTPYGHEKKNLLGIHQLLAEGVLSAAFPLHDGPFKTPPEGPKAPHLNQRQVLYQHWARWGKWYKYQPLHHVRRYFGEKVALYFAWLGFYTGWLLPAAVVGTLVFLVGCFLVFSDIPTQELCGSKDSFEMCPLCLDCPFWLLSSACALAQAGRLFDHGGTVFFSLFMALWAVLLLEYWKRKSATLAYRWDCSDYEDIEERPRPQFAASAPTTAPNPITGEDEPYFPERSRARRMLAGSVVIVVMVAVVVMCLVSIILYRAIMAIVVSRSGNTLLAAWKCTAPRPSSRTPSPSRCSSSSSSTSTPRPSTLPSSRAGLWDTQATTTPCLESATRSARLEAASSSWHRSSWSSWWASRSSTTCRRSSSLLQFGFVTIFVAACPLAPLFALLNNWVEIRLDARKFVCEYRRPVAERAQDIGIWFHILAGITHLAVTSNAFLLAFSSDFLPRAYYQWTRAHDLRGFVNFTLARAPPSFSAAHNRTCRYRAFRDDDGHYSQTYWNLLAIRLAFVIVFEHVVFSIGRLLDLLVPDIPESVGIKVKREYYLAKQALAENEALFGTNGAKDEQHQGSEAMAV